MYIHTMQDYENGVPGAVRQMLKPPVAHQVAWEYAVNITRDAERLLAAMREYRAWVELWGDIREIILMTIDLAEPDERISGDPAVELFWLNLTAEQGPPPSKDCIAAVILDDEFVQRDLRPDSNEDDFVTKVHVIPRKQYGVPFDLRMKWSRHAFQLPELLRGYIGKEMPGSEPEPVLVPRATPSLEEQILTARRTVAELTDQLMSVGGAPKAIPIDRIHNLLRQAAMFNTELTWIKERLDFIKGKP